jgi:hypothetical protein
MPRTPERTIRSSRRGLAIPALSAHRHSVRSQLALVGLGLVALSAPGAAQEASASGNLPFTDPYAFVDRFTDSSDVAALGFPSGPEPFLNLGMIVEKEEAEKAGAPIDIVSATASNGQVNIDLVYADIGVFELWDNFGGDPAVFDPKSHGGSWVITATDSKGASASTQPVLLEYGFVMPFVEDVNVEQTTSGDLKVTWIVPELEPEIAAKCDVDYRLRLLKNIDQQLYRSDGTTESSVTVPAATLEEKAGGDLAGVWGRIEMACRDKDEQQKNNAGEGQLEARSNTFFPLQ